MASQPYKIFKTTDDELLRAFSQIAEEVGDSGAFVELRLHQQHQHPLSAKVAELEENQDVAALRDVGGHIFATVTLRLPGLGEGVYLTVSREAVIDQASISFPDSMDTQKAARFVAACQRRLRTFGGSEQADKLLGDDLAEFYRRREEGLLRLESLSQRLIEQNERYRIKLDEETANIREQLEAELKAEGEAAQEKIAAREAAVEERAEAAQGS